ncbi:hypothetical protein [Reinekea blandensis]|uniref:Uncharacterized protein n=1 Tax=Reinekea blandensis MED297 TaxID=314283 RepID=A4BHA1_9GAMM|nr:hypothetical protein [Reinekea blandensis]EAR08449.1 hypothetical protein MED297_17692 [Reinekea sp. MED297] [Reinekea blandensis MED297]
MKSIKDIKREQQERYYVRVQNRDAAPARVDKNDSFEAFKKSASRFRVQHA